MGSIIRSIFGVPIAVVIVVGLFLFMYGLIRVDELPEASDSEPVNIQLGRQIEDSDVTNQRRFERPQLDQPPPPPPAINQANFQPQVEGVRAATPTFEANVNIGSAFNPDRDAQPLVRIPPQESLFQRCIRSDEARQERVRLEFDVTPEGNVTNVRVLDSTDSCYERSAVRAAERWRYQPKIVDGEAEPRFGVQTTIVYAVGGG